MRKLLLYPTESQREVLDALNANRIVVCAAGRRYGKTLLAMMAMVIYAMSKPNQRIIYAGPSYNLVKSVYKEILGSPGMYEIIAGNAEQPVPWIRCKGTNSLIEFFSMDKPNRNRGRKANLLIIDEARDIRESDWKAVLSPSVSDVRGDTLIISTFRGKDQWFYKLYDQGLSPNAMGVKSFLRESSEGICFQTAEGKEELERQRQIVGDAVYDVEYLCKPVSTGDNLFKQEHISRCTNSELHQQTESKMQTVLGWDMGRVADPSAIIIENALGQVLKTEVFPLKEDWERQANKVAAYARQYNALVVAETNGTNRDSVLALLRSRMPFGLRDVMVRANTKESLVNQVVMDLERGLISIPEECTELLKQLRNYEVRSRGDFLSFCCPDGHDDLVMALCLCQHALAHGWIGRGGNFNLGMIAH
jgi:hypothetical protein